uniref:Uncharacterized protein n=1 Tax=Klebsiella pneumoniae TaxID=573 RepID=A0A6M5ZYG5_KLEPN|nr:hypothetical protein [Klebsiella pneumoniae]QJX13718.1 hypothetical protein [Klebsiella pneumoniae]QLG02314.1 hypothetical protein [Klebsiella pneumoniae]
MLNHVFYAEKNVFQDIYYYPNRSEKRRRSYSRTVYLYSSDM